MHMYRMPLILANCLLQGGSTEIHQQLMSILCLFPFSAENASIIFIPPGIICSSGIAFTLSDLFVLIQHWLPLRVGCAGPQPASVPAALAIGQHAVGAVESIPVPRQPQFPCKEWYSPQGGQVHYAAAAVSASNDCGLQLSS